MSKSVSNDALWEKLSDIEEKINRYLKEQTVSVPTQEQAGITSELRANKDEIVDIFKKCIQGLGIHCDSHFKTIYKNIGQLREDTDGIYKILTCLWRMRESEDRSKTEAECDKSYLNFKFFKLRKLPLVITILGLLVFVLTLFCMKQQNDYSLLNGKYYRQNTVIREMQSKVDSLQNVIAKPMIKKK